MGYTYEIQYKIVVENKDVDALSRVTGSEILCLALSTIESDLLDTVVQSWDLDSHLQHIMEKLQQWDTHSHYSWLNNQLRRKGELVVRPDTSLKKKRLDWGHTSPVEGHSGREAIMRRLKSIFHGKGMNREVSAFVRSCVVCQACKYDNAAYPGMLQPLQIPNEVWKDISIDFIEG